ncbi:MAG: HPF/RaiA family ribosome-associated protein [bacterium]
MKWQMMFDRVSTSGDIKEKVVKKFSGIETYLGKMKSKLENGFVTLSRGERWGYRVKAMFRVPGKEVVVEGKSETLLSAIDEAYSKASREVKSYLERIKERGRRK